MTFWCGMDNMNKEYEKIIREEWFKDHQVLEHDLIGYSKGRSPIETLIWGKPGTIHYKIFYTLINRHGVLSVYGDLGEAVYRWYGNTWLEGIARFNLDYFHGKTTASELGRVGINYDWDEGIARKSIFEHFKEEMDCKGYKKFLDSYLAETLHNKNEFIAELNAGGYHDIFGQDYWEWLYGVGDHIPIRTQAHLIGIKMAFGK